MDKEKIPSGQIEERKTIQWLKLTGQRYKILHRERKIEQSKLKS